MSIPTAYSLRRTFPRFVQTQDPKTDVSTYVTTWGGDPAWKAEKPVNMPMTSNFLGGTNGASVATPDSMGGGFSLEENQGIVVDVVGYAVSFDPERRLWYADIEVDPTVDIPGVEERSRHLYYPFIRLSLARFQPESLPGCRLSPVVVTDFIQVAPDRTVTVTDVSGMPDLVEVVVTGLTYDGNLGPSDSPLDLPHGSQVEVTIERRVGDDELLGWAVQGDTVTILDSSPNRVDLAHTWSGQVALPHDRQPGEFRLMIKEYESFASDSQDPDIAWAIARRIVFAEAIIL